MDDTTAAVEANPEANTLLAERLRRLRDEADAALMKAQRDESLEWAAVVGDKAKRAIAMFSVVPCNGETARIPLCTELVMRNCELADLPSCPRRIRAFDEEREKQ